MEDQNRTSGVLIGESYVGEGAEAAHINTVLGGRDGPVGTAWATALATPRPGHTAFVVILRPNLPVKPLTLFVNKAPMADEQHGNLTWGAAQAGVAGGTPDLGKGISPVIGIVVEAVLTFFLVSVIFGTAVDERAPKSIYPLAIGLTIALDIMAGGPLTGAAMNPARTFGSAIASGHWDNHLVYWIGPLIGGAVGAGVHHFFFMVQAPSLATATRGGPAPAEERGEPTIASG